MRESIGTSFLLNFIVIFIVFIMAFLAATLSYYKAYKVNNAILHSIEQFEGYNSFAKQEINDRLESLGYQKIPVDCPKTRFAKGSDVKGVLMGDGGDGSEGYCIYVYFNENAKPKADGGKSTTDIYYSFGVVSYMRMEIPLLGKIIKMPVYSKTYNIYYFTGSAVDPSKYQA